jgi:mono/diheme cytochrome c family protein
VKQSTLIIIGTAALAGVGLVWAFAQNERKDTRNGITIPTLSQTAQQGEALFNANCAACHGKNAAGTKKGPPLIHKIYEPSHHSDISFQRAAKLGVRGHHWPYGDMPHVTGVSESDVGRIVSYVREVQRANGIQ